MRQILVWFVFVGLASVCLFLLSRGLPKVFGWPWYAVVQLIMLFYTVLGWVVLIPFCLAHAWRPALSIKGDRPIDCWSFLILNYIYANPEDGVSAKYALVWVDGVLCSYVPPWWSGAGYRQLPNTNWTLVKVWLWAAWRAYCWSAWRNSCDALKYWFSWDKGPQAEVWGHKVGWWPENGYKVPLL